MSRCVQVVCLLFLCLSPSAVFCGRLDTPVENPSLFQKNRLCSECCVILYIHAKQEKEKENLGHPSVFQLQPCQLLWSVLSDWGCLFRVCCVQNEPNAVLWVVCRSIPSRVWAVLCSLSSGLYELFAVSWLVI